MHPYESCERLFRSIPVSRDYLYFYCCIELCSLNYHSMCLGTGSIGMLGSMSIAVNSLTGSVVCFHALSAFTIIAHNYLGYAVLRPLSHLQTSHAKLTRVVRPIRRHSHPCYSMSCLSHFFTMLSPHGKHQKLRCYCHCQQTSTKFFHSRQPFLVQLHQQGSRQ